MEQTTAPELEELILPHEIQKYGAPQRWQMRVLMKKGLFPRPIRLSERRIAWLKRELVA